jgi:hypothetical protein
MNLVSSVTSTNMNLSLCSLFFFGAYYALPIKVYSNNPVLEQRQSLSYRAADGEYIAGY